LARITWGDVGQRFYENGVDQGVLYASNLLFGVPWPGLLSVSESPSGGDAKAYYIDGEKYVQLSGREEFEATINAISSPEEFLPCDGIVPVQNGLLVTQQPRKTFSMSYRTNVGNDVDGDNHGYKIHLVYNALANPSARNYRSLGSSSDISDYSWKITTLPPTITGYRRTAHMIVDSRYADPTKLASLEDIIYGSDSNDPSLPSPDDLIALFA